MLKEFKDDWLTMAVNFNGRRPLTPHAESLVSFVKNSVRVVDGWCR